MTNGFDTICTRLRNSIDTVTLEWVERVQHDEYLHADDALTTTQIIDHIPQMLEELCDLLTRPEEPDFKEIRAASHHGYIRSAEGYTLTELLRELELLRDCVFDFVAELEEDQGANVTAKLRVLRLINGYFGEDVIFVVEHYLKRHDGN